MNDTSSVALERVLSSDLELTQPADDAKEVIRRVSKIATKIGLDDASILSALAEPHDALSMKGLYYRTQATIVRYISPLGGTILSLLGAVALAWLVKRGAQAVLNLIKKGVNLFVCLMSVVAGAPVAALLSFFGIKPCSDEVRDGEFTPDFLVLTLAAGMPGPVAGVLSIFNQAFEGAPTPTVTTPPGPGPMSGVSTPATTLPPVAAAPPPTTAPSTTTASGGSTMSEISTGVNLAGQILPWLVNLFVDGEVRDESDNVNAAALIAATHVHPQDPRRAVTLASEITRRMRGIGNGDYAEDHAHGLGQLRTAAATRW